MVSLLPAVLIGGPPNAGKSVLTYNLTQALRKRNIIHYVLRANPDGEGDWSQEMDTEENVRHILIKGDWTPEFVQRICSDLERRPLPLLVDIGGLPTDREGCIFRTCTHSLLLLRADKEESAQRWRHLVATYGLLPLAELYSEHSSVSSITSHEPVIKGIIAGLERRTTTQGPLFDALIERISALFGSYTLSGLEKIHLGLAPAELVVNLGPLLQTLAPGSQKWQPEMLPRLLAELPADTPLAVYGRGPTWLYGALVVHTGVQPYYQFNTRLGWVVPPPLQISTVGTPEIQIRHGEREDATVLEMNIVTKNLDYSQSEHLPFPPVSVERGLILSGGIPQWLLTALVRLYNAVGVSWIAYHYPQDQIAVVVCSRIPTYAPGSTISMPIA